MTHVFISYSREDFEFVDVLRVELERSNIECWIDLQGIRAGEEWVPAIDEAIVSAYAVLLVLSPAATSSQFVTYEWVMAHERSVPIVPVIYEKTELHRHLDGYNYLDCTTQVAYSRALPKIIERLTELRDLHEASGHIVVTRNMPDVYKRTVAALNSNLAAERKEAIDNLVAIGDSFSKEVLRKAIHHLMPDVRLEAIRAIRELNYERALPDLVIVINSNKTKVESNEAILALATFGSQEAFVALFHCIVNVPTSTLWSAIRLFGELYPESAPFNINRKKTHIRKNLLALLNNHTLENRYIIPNFLYHVIRPNLDPLIAYLSDDDVDVRMSIVEIIGDNHVKEAVPSIAALLQDTSTDRFNKRICDAAANALFYIDTPEANSHLTRWRRTDLGRNWSESDAIPF